MKVLAPAALGLGLLWPVAGPSPAAAEGRHLAIIVDTSGSMRGNDPPRYTMQLSKVISDLLNDDDELTVVRMSDDGSCGAGVSSALALRLDPHDRSSFKAALAAHTECNTGTNYSAAIRTAVDILSRTSGKERLLLMLADSGGLGRCSTPLTREMQTLRAGGAQIAAINIGTSAGGFDGNPAIDFTTVARDAHELVDAVAKVYQRFLGSKKVQTGEVRGAIEVEIPPYTREAFLVVAADGPIPALEQGLGNPSSDSIDLDYRGGGRSLGRDGRARAYRIARLLRPEAGRFEFRAPGLADRAGWMLLLDSSIGVRLLSAPTAALGKEARLEVEVYDQSTNKRIADPSVTANLDLTFQVEGREVRLGDRGEDGDRQAGDGILTGTVTFRSAGRTQLRARLENEQLDRRFTLETEVLEAGWVPSIESPSKATIDRTVKLMLRLEAVGNPALLKAPERIDVRTGSQVVELFDHGKRGDATASDGLYTGEWTPTSLGEFDLDYAPQGGTATTAVNRPLEVLGFVEFGQPVPIQLGTGKRRSMLEASLDLGSTRVRGAFDLGVTSDMDLAQSVLEVDLGRGFEHLGEKPLPLRLIDGGATSWPVRLRVGSCPEACSSDRPWALRLAGEDAQGQPLELAVPVRVEILPDVWWLCWWPVIALGLGAIVTGIGIHGFVSPSRFPPLLGVLLSQEEDLDNEGMFYAIRRQRGSRSGFYRDARLYVTADYRLSSKPGGAVAKLRADRKLVRIEPVAGAALWRQSSEGSWERVPAEESLIRPGVIYRNDLSSLFFTIRNN